MEILCGDAVLIEQTHKRSCVTIDGSEEGKMELTTEAIAKLVKEVLVGMESGKETPGVKAADGEVPIGVSNRHIHLTREHVEILFGKGYTLKKLKDLSQPGQYACEETVTIVGPSLKPIEKVRILGPERKASQVEISNTDSYVLKVKPPVRESGKIEGTPGITVIGPCGVVVLKEGVIVANRHIHMSPDDAVAFGVSDGDTVTVDVKSARPTRWFEVQVRVHKDFRLEMHIDTDDANAACLKNGSRVSVVK